MFSPSPLNPEKPMDTKLQAARDYLGPRWVNHPDYAGDPRHSNNPEIYGPARQPYLLAVKIAAQHDRAANPAFIRAQHRSQVLGESTTH